MQGSQTMILLRKLTAFLITTWNKTSAMEKWWIWVLEWVRAESSRRRLSLRFSMNKAQLRRSSSIRGKENSVAQGWQLDISLSCRKMDDYRYSPTIKFCADICYSKKWFLGKAFRTIVSSAVVYLQKITKMTRTQVWID